MWLARESGCIGFILAVVRFLERGWMVGCLDRGNRGGIGKGIHSFNKVLTN